MVMTYFLYQWVPQPVTQVPLIDTLPERWVSYLLIFHMTSSFVTLFKRPE